MRYIACHVFLLCVTYLSAQSSEFFINFQPTFEGEVVVYNEENRLEKDGDIQIETLKFYISNIELFNGDQLVFSEKDSYHLLDIESPESFSLDLNTPPKLSFTSIKFDVGVDSLTNVSGAFGGDLDPTNGMYWTWQSGYINFKLEGVATDCPARHNRFVYHIGGYEAPHRPLQTIELGIETDTEIAIEISMDKIFETINVAEQYHIMRPGEEALAFSKLFTSIFSISK